MSDHGAQLRWKGQLDDHASQELISQHTLSTFPVEGNRRKPTTFGRALTDSFDVIQLYVNSSAWYLHDANFITRYP